MKSDFSFSRYTVLWIVVICYLLPLIGLCAYSTFTDSWNVMSLGLLVAALGSLVIFFMMTRWEVQWHMPQQVLDLSTNQQVGAEVSEELPLHRTEEVAVASAFEQQLEEANRIIENLRAEINILSTQHQQSSEDKEQLLQQAQKTLGEWEEYRQATCQQIEHQQGHILQLQEAIAEQKALIEKKQQQTGLLESKVGDLTYEIKTLLQLAEAQTTSIYNEPLTPAMSTFMPEFLYEEIQAPPPERQIRSNDEASLQLKRCLDIAQKNNRFVPFQQSNQCDARLSCG